MWEEKTTRRSCGERKKGESAQTNGPGGKDAAGGKGTTDGWSLVAELSLGPCWWLLFAPSIRPQHLGKTIGVRKRGRGEKDGALEKSASQVPKVEKFPPGNTSTHYLV